MHKICASFNMKLIVTANKDFETDNQGQRVKKTFLKFCIHMADVRHS